MKITFKNGTVIEAEGAEVIAVLSLINGTEETGKGESVDIKPLNFRKGKTCPECGNTNIPPRHKFCSNNCTQESIRRSGRNYRRNLKKRLLAQEKIQRNAPEQEEIPVETSSPFGD